MPNGRQLPLKRMPALLTNRPLSARRALLVLGAVLLCLLPACRAATESPASLKDVTLTVNALDSSGVAAPGSLVVWYAWPAPSLLPPGSDPDNSTDLTGTLHVALGAYPNAALDSLDVTVVTRGCDYAGQSIRFTRRLRSNDLTPAHDTVTVDMRVAPPAPPMSATPGDYCASGVHPAWGPFPEYGLTLRVESVTGVLIQGLWWLGHTASYGTEEGTFTGAATTSWVSLTLVNNYPTTCGGQLVGSVAEDGAWGPLIFTSPTSCEGNPHRLDFARVPETASR